MKRSKHPIKDGSLCKRIEEILQDEGPMDAYRLAEWAGCTYLTLVRGSYLTAMRLAGRIYKHSYRPNPVCGNPIVIWAAGFREDAAYQPVSKEHHKQVRREHAEWLRERYGRAVARKILQGRNSGGADRVVIDGKTIYQRKKIKPRRQEAVE